MNFERSNQKPIWFLLIFSLINFTFLEARYFGYLLLFNLIIATISTYFLFVEDYTQRKKTPLREEIEIKEGGNKK